jgi:M6 family metalloprotease-like protein
MRVVGRRVRGYASGIGRELHAQRLRWLLLWFATVAIFGPSVAGAQISAPADTGVLSVGILEDAAGVVRYVGVLMRSDGTSRTVNLPDDVVRNAGGANALNGQRVTLTLRARLSGSDATVSSLADVISLRPIAPALRVGVSSLVTGTERWAIVGCKFADRTTEPATAATYLGYMQTQRSLYSEMSRGAYQIQGEIGTMWVTMPGSLATYIPGGAYDAAALLRDCLAVADPVVDFTPYSGIVLQFNGNLNGVSFAFLGPIAVTVDGVARNMRLAFMSDWAAHKTYGHEIGHTLGWQHTGLSDAQPYSSVWDIVSGGSLLPGSNGIVHTLAVQKQRAGWLAASEVRDARSGEDTVLLSRSAQPASGAPQVLYVRSADGTSYVLEVREPVGLDNVPGGGVLLHRIPQTADLIDAYLIPRGSATGADALWTVGSTFTDVQRALTIRVLSAEGSGTYRVAVSRNATCDIAATVEPTNGGTVVVQSGGISGPCDRSVTLQATPATNYGFVMWRDANQSTLGLSPTLSLALPTSRSVQAVFSTCVLSLTQTAGGSIGLTNGSAAGPCGRTVTVAAAPDPNTAFLYWQRAGNAISSGNPLNVTLSTNDAIAAKFSPCSVVLISSTGGASALESGTATGACGRSVSVRAQPALGYRLTTWQLVNDGGGTSTIPATPSIGFSVTRQVSVAPIFEAANCSLTVSNVGGTTASIQSGGATGPCAREVTVSATLDPTRAFLGWREGSVVVSSTSSYSFRLDTDRTLTAVSSPCEVIIPPLAGGTALVESGGNTGACGRLVQLRATADLGYRVKEWRYAVDGVEYPLASTSTALAWTVDRQVTLRPVFEAANCTLVLLSSGGGTASITSGGATGPCSRDITLSAGSDPTIAFLGWKQGDYFPATTVTWTFRLDADRTVTAMYAPCTITVQQATGGTAQIASGTSTGVCGRQVTISATPGLGYRLSDWRVSTNGAPETSWNFSATLFTWTVNGQQTFVPVFSAASCGLTLTTVGNGTASVISGGADGPCQRPISLQATPSSGSSFLRWRAGSGASVSFANPYDFTIASDLALAAEFSPCDVTTSVVGLGTVAVTQGTASGPCDRGVTLTALPAAGNQLASWKITWALGGVSTIASQPVLSLGVSQAIAVEATFSGGGCSLSVTSGVGGTAAISAGGSEGACGRTVSVAASPSNGYGFANWTDGGAVVSAATSYTFVLNASRSIVANFAAAQCSVTLGTPTGGTSAVTSGGGTGACGRAVTLTATPLANYVFDAWIENGASVGTQNPWPITLNSSRTLTAVFAATQCGIAVSATTGGTASITGGGAGGTCGRTVTVSATPAPGFTFVSWTEDGNPVSTSPTYSFPLSTSRALVATFATAQCTLTVSSTLGGSAAITAGGTTGDCGRSVTVTATANSNFGFVNWTDTGSPVSTAVSYTFVLSSSRSLMANFTVSQCTLSVSAGTGGSAAITAGGATGDCGRSVTVAATPNTNFGFVNWTDLGTPVSTSASYTFTLSNTRSLVANFAASQCTLNVSAGSGGSAAITAGGATGDCGRSVTVTATANTNFGFLNWTEAGTPIATAASYTFTLSSTRSLVANFTASQCTLTVLSSVGGSIAVSAGSVTGACGRTVSVTATPAANFTFSNWTEGGVSQGSTNPWPITLNANRSIGATFAITQCTLSVSAGSGGSAAITAGGATGDCGRSVTVTATANTNFGFLNWTEAGNPISTTASYTFALSSNRSVVANFTASQCTLTVLSSVGGSIAVTAGSATGACGRTVSLTATPASNYSFSSWIEGGVSQGSTNPWAITLNANRTIGATFSIAQCTLGVSASSGGGAAITAGGATGDCGRSVTVTATANTNFAFLNWTEAGTPISTTPSYTFALSSNRSVVANFAASQCTVTILSPTGGSAAVTSGGATGACGRSVSITASPSTGYNFTGWTEAGVTVSSSNPWQLPLASSRAFGAVFTRQCRVQLTQPANAQLEVAAGATVGDCGRAVTLSATLMSGWTFGGWTEGGITVSTVNPWTVTLLEDRTFSARATPVSPVRLIIEGAPGRIVLASSGLPLCSLSSGAGPLECLVPRQVGDQYLAEGTSTSGFQSWSGGCTGRGACPRWTPKSGHQSTPENRPPQAS